MRRSTKRSAARARRDRSCSGRRRKKILVAIAACSRGIRCSPCIGAAGPSARLPRLAFIQPDRAGLPALDRYASLQMPDGIAEDRRRDRCDARLQASLPALPDRAGLRRAVPRRAGRRRAGRHPRAGGAGRHAHHVRRSGLLQRADARAADRRSAASRIPAADLRRDHQGRAPARASRAAAGAGADRLPVRHERGRVGRRRGAGEAGEGAHARRLHRGRGAVPRRPG